MMIARETKEEIKNTADRLFAQGTDWITFYREVLGVQGVVRRLLPTRQALATFEQTEIYEDILNKMTRLREQGSMEFKPDEPTRMITVRLPKSMHEALRVEAHEHRTSMNKLCISKLMQFIDSERVPAEL